MHFIDNLLLYLLLYKLSIQIRVVCIQNILTNATYASQIHCVGKINYCYHLDPCINCINVFLIVRSTPCPHVKHGDEWGEPTNCDSGDGCPYCHTRTEQQFHPEVGNVPLQYHKPVHVMYMVDSLCSGQHRDLQLVSSLVRVCKQLESISVKHL